MITYNGEIYFKDIRTELPNLSIHFRSNSDTEVIVNSRKMGHRSNQPLQWNVRICRLGQDRKMPHLGRDRYGIKPLYVVKVTDKYHSIRAKSNNAFLISKKLSRFSTFMNI